MEAYEIHHSLSVYRFDDRYFHFQWKKKLLSTIISRMMINWCICAIALSKSSSALLIPLATLVIMTCLPLKRDIGTFLSAATMIHFALAISSSVRTFFLPPAPFVSTLIEIFLRLACLL